MNLPPSLAQWAGYLKIFPEEVSLALKSNHSARLHAYWFATTPTQ